MTNNNPLISVIIPVYNTEKYLDRCVSSVVDQTYKNLEIILVDDGSPDKCPGMCDEWAKKDPRIRVIHKENGGAADAKNAGLDIASGDYIAIVDSDDFIASDMYDDLLRISSEYDADIVDSLAKKFYSYDDTKITPKRDGEIAVLTAEEALKELIADKTIRQTPWNKLYKSSIVGGTRFPKGRYIDDEFWTYRVIGDAEKYVLTSDMYYYYLQRQESAMGRRYSVKRLDGLDALFERYEYIKDRFPGISEYAKASLLGDCRYHFQMLCYYSENDPDKKLRNGILSRIRDLGSVDITKRYKGKQVAWMKAFLKAPYFTSKIRNMFKIGW